jgi:hypothetical protein
MTQHKVGTREEWQVAREALLEREKELTRRNDELARERRELPWVRVDEEYTFDTDQGAKSLAELFDGRPQLVVYHFMFGPRYAAGCPVCSSAADTFDGAVEHLKARDVTFLCISRAPLETAGLQAAHGLVVPLGLVARQRLQLRLRRLGHGGADCAVPRRRRPSRSHPDGDRLRDRTSGIYDGAASTERLRPFQRGCLPHLLVLRARRRDRHGLLSAARPDTKGTRRG